MHGTAVPVMGAAATGSRWLKSACLHVVVRAEGHRQVEAEKAAQGGSQTCFGNDMGPKTRGTLHGMKCLISRKTWHEPLMQLPMCAGLLRSLYQLAFFIEIAASERGSLLLTPGLLKHVIGALFT